jgi:hypothetical protein
MKEEPLIFDTEEEPRKKAHDEVLKIEKTIGEVLKIENVPVTEKDIFNLSKYILLAAALMYIAVAIARANSETAGIKEVWEYSKVFLNSIISLVLGLYFGRKEKSS